MKKNWGMKKKILPQAIGVALFTLSSSAVYAGVNADNWVGLNLKAGISALKVDDDKNNVWADHDGYIYDFNSSGQVSDAGSSEDKSYQGFVSVGYDFKIADNTLLGFFGEFDFGEAESRETAGFNANDGTFGNEYTLSDIVTIKNSLSLGAKLTRLVNDKTAVYVTAGITSAEIEQESSMRYNSYSYESYDDKYSSQDNEVGPFIGIGAEYKLNEKTGISLEYRYTDFGSINKPSGYNYSAEGVYVNSYDESSADAKTDVTTDSLKIAITYQF